MASNLITLEDMRGGVQSDLNVSSHSSLYPPDTIDAAINRAYVNKIARLFRWPALEDAKMTSTQKDQEYYDCPDIWTPDSMWRLEVDDEQYGEGEDGSPMAFEDYLIWRADSANANSTEKKWAVQWLRFFMWPIPTAQGSNNISIWGQKNADKLTADAAETIFSKNLPECNEAIVLEAVAILKKKGEAPKTGQMLSDEAKQIVLMSFNKIRQEKSKYEKTQPFFYVEDMFGKGTTKQKTGNF